MPTTRRQAALEESGIEVKSASRPEKPKNSPKTRGTKRGVGEVAQPEKPEKEEEPPEKKMKQKEEDEKVSEPKKDGMREKEERPRDGPMRGE